MKIKHEELLSKKLWMYPDSWWLPMIVYNKYNYMSHCLYNFAFLINIRLKLKEEISTNEFLVIWFTVKDRLRVRWYQ